VVNWSAKGCFGAGKIPIKELGAGVSDESCLIVPTSKDILLKSGEVVSKWEAASKRGDQIGIVTAKFNMWFGSEIS
jgi:hypothetical protein